MDRRTAQSLDRYITGNYGEDSVSDEPFYECPFCGADLGEKIPKKCPECGAFLENEKLEPIV